MPAAPWQDPAAVPFIKIRDVVKKFDSFVAVDDVWLDIYRGEFFSLLGPSGCGKTTLLRMLAGFEEPTAGTIEIDGVDMSEVPPYRRPVNMMFQSYALFPHMNVEQNIAFGLKQESVGRAEIARRVEEMLSLVQLTEFARRKPHELVAHRGVRRRVMFERSRPAGPGTASPSTPSEGGSGAPAKLYLDDLRVGQRFTSGSVQVDEAEIKAFAAQYDPQPFHLDEEAARASLFRGLAASGWHTAALSMRLLVDGGAPIAGGVIGASGELAWPRPTRPGDVLTVETEVLEVVPSSSRPDRGFATLRSETRNQNGEPVQIFTMRLVVPRRAARSHDAGGGQPA